MAKYTITNQKELRRSFWVFCKEFGGEFEREANKWHYIAKFIRTCNTLLIMRISS